ncbi:MAG TPA: phosphate ABC transporter permease PstA [Actinomycetota bacterium]|nr:phosphate ABC transporter permease PstA [Actinomycetota bacterium]
MARETALTRPMPTPAELVRQAILGRRRDVRGAVFQWTLLLAMLLALAVLTVLLVDIVQGALPVIRDRGVKFLGQNISRIPDRAGVAQGIKGSLIITGTVMLLAFPIGIGAAIYLEEYARDTRLTRIINANIRNLAGVPSIVYGLLGIALFVTFAPLARLTGGRSQLTAGLTMSILVLPIVVITAAEAIRAVPESIREAGFGVGATRWEVIRSHVLPYAAPGIFTGAVLTIARAFGEAAPLILIGAATGFLSTGTASFAEQLRGPYTALPVQVYAYAKQNLRTFENVTAAAALALLAVLLLVNLTAILLRNRYERRW